MDVLVEQIMYDETRDYVKKVSGHYARYVELYGEPGARGSSKDPAGDDPDVIDFSPIAPLPTTLSPTVLRRFRHLLQHSKQPPWPWQI